MFVLCGIPTNRDKLAGRTASFHFDLDFSVSCPMQLIHQKKQSSKDLCSPTASKLSAFRPIRTGPHQ